jgi:hypothetical protein
MADNKLQMIWKKAFWWYNWDTALEFSWRKITIATKAPYVPPEFESSTCRIQIESFTSTPTSLVATNKKWQCILHSSGQIIFKWITNVCECVDWINLVQDRVHWWASVSTVMNLRVPLKVGISWVIWVDTSFWKVPVRFLFLTCNT